MDVQLLRMAIVRQLQGDGICRGTRPHHLARCVDGIQGKPQLDAILSEIGAAILVVVAQTEVQPQFSQVQHRLRVARKPGIRGLVELHLDPATLHRLSVRQCAVLKHDKWRR